MLAVQDNATVCCVTPVPEKDRGVGVLLALLANDAFPLTAPVAWGAKTTATVVDAPGKIVKGVAALVLKPEPVRLTDETITLAFPVFERVAFCVLLAPTATFPKDKVDGEMLNVPTGAETPEPASDTTGADPPALLAIDADPVAVPTLCGLKINDSV